MPFAGSEEILVVARNRAGQGQDEVADREGANTAIIHGLDVVATTRDRPMPMASH